MMKHSNTLIKLNIHKSVKKRSKYDKSKVLLSFIAKFTNLQELVLTNRYIDFSDDFKILQFVTFPQLQILKFIRNCPRHELLIKFLENNGKNLKEFYVGHNNNLLNLAIAKFCPNLRKLYTVFEKDELEALKIIFNSCQYLENMNVLCSYGDCVKEYFDILAKYSPKNFHELTLFPSCSLHSKDLEEFFINWKNRSSQKSLSFNVYHHRLNDENLKIIEKYKKLGIIKKCEMVYDF